MRVRCPGQNPLLLGPVLKANKNTFTIIYYLRGYTILVVQLYLYNEARGYKSGTTAFYRPAVSLNDLHSVKKKMSSCTIASWEEKSFHHIAMIAKSQQTKAPQIWQKKTRKQTKNCHVQGMTFLCMIFTFLPSVDNSSGCLCQERLLRFRNFASMLMWRHTCTLYFMTQELRSSKFSCKLPS